MRWIWIDRIIQLERGRVCVAVKNVSLGEEVFNALAFDGAVGPPPTVFPNTLVIEGMAQTAGILVGHYNEFREFVVLAKIGRAQFSTAVRPGDTIQYTAQLKQISAAGASTSGRAERRDPATGRSEPLAEIDLMFSHFDASRTGVELPAQSAVFRGRLLELLQLSGVPVGHGRSPLEG